MYYIICFLCVLILSIAVLVIVQIKKQPVTSRKKSKEQEASLSHLQVVEILDRAFQEDNFRILYQPIYGVKDKKIVACEALLRIHDSEFGWLTPSTFIPTAESCGKIFEIGTMVIGEVCKFLSDEKIRKLNLEYINVNLSMSECKNERLVDELIEIIDNYGIEHEKIRIEIKEAFLNEEHKVLRENMQRLSDLGVGLALDGYGTGNSSFSNLITFPFCAVKFDRTMLWTAMANTKALYAMCASINMLKDLDMRIVVEGAESEEMVEQLKELKCDYLQGFYFARPMNQEAFVEFMSNY